MFYCHIITYNPCDNIDVPKSKKEHQIVSMNTDEIDIMKQNILNNVCDYSTQKNRSKWNNRDMCLISLGISTGMRVSAIANIDVSDIDFENHTIRTIEKGEIEKDIYISDKLIDLINIWMIDRSKILGDVECDALFISNHKSRIGVTTIREMISKYSKNIDKHITPHKLRSTCATNLYEQTGDIYLVADVLGHHNIQNTKRYAKISDSKKRAAADVLSKLI